MPPTFAAHPGDMFCTVVSKSNLWHCYWQKTKKGGATYGTWCIHITTGTLDDFSFVQSPTEMAAMK